jgi:putative membrane protein
MVMNKHEQSTIAALVHQTELQTDAQVIVIFADRASHYRIIPWIYTTLIALPLPFLLYHVTGLTITRLLTLQLLTFLALWLLVSYTPIKLALTPRAHKRARLTQRTRDLIWSYRHLNANPRPYLLVFIAKAERQAMLKSDVLLTNELEKAMQTLTSLLHEGKTSEAIEQVLRELTPRLAILAPKTTAQNSLQDAPFNL